MKLEHQEKIIINHSYKKVIQLAVGVFLSLFQILNNFHQAVSFVRVKEIIKALQTMSRKFTAAYL